MMSNNAHYRPEIDGLRAIAVLSVMIFHAQASWLPSGFLGVDIFFVISGYLITGIMFREMQTGTFSLTHFYKRRAKRILPIFLIVLMTTLFIFNYFFAILNSFLLIHLIEKYLWKSHLLKNFI